MTHSHLRPRPLRFAAPAALVAAGLIALGPWSPTPAPLPTPGLINVNFTPVHLVTASTALVPATLGKAQGDVLPVTCGTPVKGTAPAPTLALDLSDLPEDAKTKLTSLTAEGRGQVVVVTADLAELKKGDGRIDAVLCTDRGWFQLERKEQQWLVRTEIPQDPSLPKIDLSAVWAGTAPMLARLAEALVANPKLDVPVTPECTWGAGGGIAATLPEGVSGIIPAELSPSRRGVLVSATGGDRFFACDQGKLVDATAQVKLAGASRLACLVDADGAGRLDVVTWNGKGLATQLQGADGTLAAPVADAEAQADLKALRAIGRGRLLAVRGGGLAVLAWQATGWTATALPPSEAGALVDAVIADLDGDGVADVAEVGAKALCWRKGQAGGAYAAPVRLPATDTAGTGSLHAIDADGDGRLDLLLMGGPMQVLLNGADGAWHHGLAEADELVYHGGNITSNPTSAWIGDLTGDGRADVVAFWPGNAVHVFFNRGFSCFGFARELDLAGPDSKGPGPAALANGAAFGTVIDVDGDGAPDVVAVNPERQLVVMPRSSDNGSRLLVQVAVPDAVGSPMAVGITDGKRSLGACLALPGQPAFVGRRTKGPATLTWNAGGQAMKTTAIVTAPSRIEAAAKP